MLASKPEERLILRCRGLDEIDDPVADLRGQAEEHGRSHQLPEWIERAKQLRESVSDPAMGFAAAVTELRRDLPNLALYADNAESLQDAPASVPPSPQSRARSPRNLSSKPSGRRSDRLSKTPSPKDDESWSPTSKPSR